MKNKLMTVRIPVCLLCMLAALVFVAIEGWLVLSGDWKLFENSGLALLQFLLRAFIALYAFAVSLLALTKREHSRIWEGIALLAASLVSLPFVSNNLSWAFVGISLLFILSDPSLWQHSSKPAD